MEILTQTELALVAEHRRQNSLDQQQRQAAEAAALEHARLVHEALTVPVGTMTNSQREALRAELMKFREE